MIRKVLFVDDDQIMLLALKKRLAKYSDTFSIILADDGVDAVGKLAENPISLVVMDLKMPRMDGVSLLAHLAGKYPDVPVIVISGYRTEDMRKLATQKGVIAYISKPFQLDDLAKVVLSSLRREAEGGTLHNVSPVVFLQLMEMESRTCTIRIIDRKTERGGVLFFKEGELYDARVNQIKGIEAAYIIFSWENVTLFIRNECPVEHNVINSSLQPIIMQAVKIKDEQAADEDAVEGEEASGEISPDDEEFGTAVLSDGPVEIASSLAPDADWLGAAPEKKSAVEKVRRLLQKEVGDKSGIEDIYLDGNMDDAVKAISELGAIFGLGALKVGYVDRGREKDEIILPGETSIIVKVDRKCAQEKILQVLSTRV
jgi:CheY-like chemotaxis protein